MEYKQKSLEIRKLKCSGKGLSSPLVLVKAFLPPFFLGTEEQPKVGGTESSGRPGKMEELASLMVLLGCFFLDFS